MAETPVGLVVKRLKEFEEHMPKLAGIVKTNELKEIISDLQKAAPEVIKYLEHYRPIEIADRWAKYFPSLDKIGNFLADKETVIKVKFDNFSFSVNGEKSITISLLRKTH